MASYESVAVPFVEVGNRQCLTREQIENDPYIADFVRRFPHCFESDLVREVLIYSPPPDGVEGLSIPPT